MRACAWAAWCVVAATCLLPARAYTVDCNTNYADCETEFSKINNEDEKAEDSLQITTRVPYVELSTLAETTETIPFLPTIPTPKTEHTTTIKPKPRLLDINDELNHFGHNNTEIVGKSKKMDLSDINLDDDDDDDVKFVAKTDFKMPKASSSSEIPDMADKFFTHLQAPFHPSSIKDGSTELDICKEDGISYRAGENIARGCDEICECLTSGRFECSPRCKHPYIRRGRKLNDPLCFESPVDECCSIIACSTGNPGDLKSSSTTNGLNPDVCRYGNNTYRVGAKWNVGCELNCTCEQNSNVVCKARCPVLHQSEKCINFPNPSDSCCEVQVCDVTHDVHEEPIHNSSITENMTEAVTEATLRPLVLEEPIGSIKVLQNNTVQINLIHTNTTNSPIHLLLSKDGGKTFNDVELKYANLLLNLEGGKDYVLKTKETGTKFNFTMTAADSGINDVPDVIRNNTAKVGCLQGGIFYEVGEEFHIDCSALCECTGHETRECVTLECPAHVGLEILYKGCVRWAPAPTPQPPNCCPRAARCISDGTCHYKEHAIPNWSEVPIELTGCEQRCFCENGDLECQEICTPLSSLPSQNLRCPLGHRPAPVNISDDDCCKEWGCVGNARDGIGSHAAAIESMPSVALDYNYVTPIIPMAPTNTVLLSPQTTTDSDLLRYVNLTKSMTIPKIIKSSKTNLYPSLFSNSMHSKLNRNYFPNDKINKESPQTNKQNSHYFPNPKPSNFDTQANFNYINRLHEAGKSTNNIPSVAKNNYTNSDVYKDNNHPKKAIDSMVIKQTYNENNTSPQKFVLSGYKIYKVDSVPNYSNIPPNYIVQNEQDLTNTNKHQLFKPNSNMSVYNLPHSNPIMAYNAPARKIVEQNSRGPLSKHITALNVKDLATKPNIHMSLYDNTFAKDLNNQETVLLNNVNPNNREKTYSALDLEHILSQLEIETEINRNLERSAQKARVKRPEAGGNSEDIQHHKPTQPSFLPTITPDMYPPEEIPDYDQNNIHRPTNSREPQVPHSLPPLPPSYAGESNKFVLLSLHADSPNSAKMLFGLPPILVGLTGSVDLRYTDKDDLDPSEWYSQRFAPANEVLSTPRLEFRLAGLKPSTTYRIKGKLYIPNLAAKYESEVSTLRTLDEPTIEEKTRAINSHLSVLDVNDTTAHITWRHFTEDELQFIDGIQVRYRPVGTPIYSMTELLHHSRSNAELQELRPGSRYEASLVLIPPPRAITELHDPIYVEFTTLPYVDPYNWTVTVEARTVGSEAAELTWRGIPPPAERWVRIYRAAHACGAGRTKEHDAFRLASRDQPNTITLTGLEPNTRCRMWLELFLTNGKVKTSNVLEVNTKSLETPEVIDNVIEASSSVSGGRDNAGKGNYYGALVAVGVVAALGALTSLLLLLVVIRRHRPHSVSITTLPSAPRESSLPPYDNPAYKLELQQETMDL